MTTWHCNLPLLAASKTISYQNKADKNRKVKPVTKTKNAGESRHFMQQKYVINN